jgi:poly(ADP-ribose) glycohydrolase ARH3
VPTAIYSFLKALDPVEGLETANPFERTVQLALTFGGDSDTICSMAGALAGAFYGESGIPGLNLDHVF